MSEHIKRAIRELKAGNKVIGYQLLTEAIKAEPRDVEAWRWIAMMQDDPIQRANHWERVLELAPLDAEAAKALGFAPIDLDSGAGYTIFMFFAIGGGIFAWFFVNQATLGVAILITACLCGILARLMQADHHQKNLIRTLWRIRK